MNVYLAICTAPRLGTLTVFGANTFPCEFTTALESSAVPMAQVADA